METVFIPYRMYRYTIPAQKVMKAFKIIMDHELEVFIDQVSDDEQLLSLTLSVNLSKPYQRKAILQLQEILPVPIPPVEGSTDNSQVT